MTCHNPGGDDQQEGLAGYRLGNAYEEIGDAETAILVRTLEQFLHFLNLILSKI